MDQPDEMAVTSHGLDIDYAAVNKSLPLCLTLLWNASEDGLLDLVSTGPDGHYLVLCKGKPRLLDAGEVPSYVLAAYDSAGLDSAPVAYRLGLN